MSSSDRAEITTVLDAIDTGDCAAIERLTPMVYDQMRRIAMNYMRQQSSGHTLQSTALVHEAFLKLCGSEKKGWRGRTHFLAAGAQAMRHILVDHARAAQREKRGGGRHRVELDKALLGDSRKDEDLLDLEEALEKLSKLDERQAKIVELRFFGGMNVGEVAEALGVSKRTIEREWTMVRAWLRRELGETLDA